MVELMIVVGIIAIIAAIGMPAWMRARENAQKSDLINEIRTTSEAFVNYATDHNNSYPALVGGYSQIPAGMAPYMPQNSTWTTSPAGGGHWGWLNLDQPVWGYRDFIILNGSGLSPASIQDIDSLLDDGDVNNGTFRVDGQTITYAIQ